MAADVLAPSMHYVHGSHIVVFCCGLSLLYFIRSLHDYIIGTRAIVRLSQCQLRNPEEYV